jgi:uncharacterized protein
MAAATGKQAVPRPTPWALTTGASVGVLGGMIGLHVAKFCLPLPIGIFGFVALQAVVMNTLPRRQELALDVSGHPTT